jgi:opacity protein-like surface antigen
MGRYGVVFLALLGFLIIFNSTEAGALPMWASLHGGVALPMETFGDFYDPGYNFMGDFGYRTGPWNFSADAMFGYNQFKGIAPLADTYIVNFNVNARYSQHIAGPAYVYAGAGPGYYRFKGGTNDFGVNAGGGLDFTLATWLGLEVGGDYHFVFDPADTRFAHVHAGVLYEFGP